LRAIEKELDAAVVKQMALRLGLSEIIVLQNATRAREAGLAMQRAGGNGAPSLHAAREVLERGPLGDEAHAIGLSYQEAAEALIDFAEGRHDAAIDRLEQALEHLAVLSDRFGHNVMIRRAHMAHNILSVMRARHRVEAVPFAKALLCWIQRRGDWPLPRSRCCHEPALEPVEKDIAVDQLAAELFRFALENRMEVEAESLADMFDDLDRLLRFRIHLLGQAIDLYNTNRHDAARTMAARYREIGCGNLPRLWAIAGFVAEE
jgi:tetratricopeptide (TPR) repeat protein